MDKVKKYRKSIRDFFADQSNVKYQLQPGLRNMFIVSEDKTHYFLIVVGWHNQKYFNDIIVHIEVKDDHLVRIHKNTSDSLMDEELSKRGIQKSDIIFEETEGDQKQALAA